MNSLSHDDTYFSRGVKSTLKKNSDICPLPKVCLGLMHSLFEIKHYDVVASKYAYVILRN